MMTMQTTGMSMAPCVVLVPREHAMTEQLPRLLSDRGWSPRLENDARLAMVEACLARRTLQIHNAWATERMANPGLIVVEPGNVDNWKELRSALVSHVPDIPIWRWNGEELEVEHDATSTQAADPPPPPPLPFTPEPLSHDEVSMLLHGGTGDTEPSEQP